MEGLHNVAMTLQETVHYGMNLSDKTAEGDWETLAVAIKKGIGQVRLGPEKRLFGLTLQHQLHCLYWMHSGLLDSENPFNHHLRHCFNYMRQMLLCAAADSLEKGDFMSRDYDTERMGGELVCQDWNQLYDVLDDNHQDFYRWRAVWN